MISPVALLGDQVKFTSQLGPLAANATVQRAAITTFVTVPPVLAPPVTEMGMLNVVAVSTVTVWAPLMLGVELWPLMTSLSPLAKLCAVVVVMTVGFATEEL